MSESLSERQSLGPFGVDTGRFVMCTDENGSLIAVKDINGDPIPENRHGEPLTISNLKGAAADEMTVLADSSDGGIDHVGTEKTLSIDAQMTSMTDELVENSAQYLQEITKAREALYETSPIFSEGMIRLVEAQIIHEEKNKHKAENKRNEHESTIGRERRIYAALLEDLAEDYRSAIDGGDVSAQAEWDEMRPIIEIKCRELEARLRLGDLEFAA